MKQRDPVTVLLGIGLVLAVLAVLSLVAGGVMKLFGFTYDSVGSLVLYFVAASVLSAVFGQVFIGAVVFFAVFVFHRPCENCSALRFDASCRSSVWVFCELSVFEISCRVLCHFVFSFIVWAGMFCRGLMRIRRPK